MMWRVRSNQKFATRVRTSPLPGIGCGIISDGKLIQGVDGNAAEVGHMIIFPNGERCNCGQIGCVEAYASASHTARRATEAVQKGEDSSLKAVLDKKIDEKVKDKWLR